MKTTKKSGVFAALAVVLLMTALLITSCPDALNLGGLSVPQAGNSDSFQPSIRLNLGGSNGRTIMPDTVLSDFTAFGLTIVNKGNSAVVVNNAIFSDDTDADYPLANIATETFEVTSGVTYEVKVDAYLIWTDAGSNVIIATGDKDVSISSGSGENEVAIILRPIVASGETGTFTWDLTYGGAADFSSLHTATLAITGLDGTPVVEKDLYIPEDNSDPMNITPAVDNATGTESIASGYYYVTVKLEQAGYAPNIFTDIVHIYKGLTSPFERIFSTLVLLPTYPVTFNNTTSAGGGPTNITYTHAEAIKDNAGYIAASLPLTESSTGFRGWYTAIGGSAGLGTKVELTDRIYQTRALFGDWYLTPKIILDALSLDLDDLSIGMAMGAGFTNISRASLLTDTGVTLSADLSGIDSELSPAFVKWIVGGYTFNEPSPVIKYGIDGTLDAVLGANNTILIMLEITATVDSVTKNYSGQLSVTIVN